MRDSRQGLAVGLQGLHNDAKMSLHLFFCFHVTATTHVSVCPSQLDHWHVERGYFIMCVAVQTSVRTKLIIDCISLSSPNGINDLTYRFSKLLPENQSQ